MRETLLERIRAGVPFLGICLGLQALFEQSEEAPEVRGLGLYPGTVRRFPADARVPHMGWNQLEVQPAVEAAARIWSAPVRLLRAQLLRSGESPRRRRPAPTECRTRRCSKSDNVFGVQFHPEKSGPVGTADREELSWTC